MGDALRTGDASVRAGTDDFGSGDVKPRFGDRAGARVLAFILCVLLGVGGLAAGIIACMDIRDTLNAPGSVYISKNYDVNDIMEDLFSDSPYMKSRYFTGQTVQVLGVVGELESHYGGGVEGREDENAGEYMRNVEPEIYYGLSTQYFAVSGEEVSSGDPVPDNFYHYVNTTIGLDEQIVFDARKMNDERFMYVERVNDTGEYVGNPFPIGRGFDEDGVKEAFEEIYAPELAKMREAVAREQRENLKREYDYEVKWLNDNGVLYYIGAGLGVSGQAITGQTDTGQALTNVKADPSHPPFDPSIFSSESVYLLAEFGEDGWKIVEKGGLADTESLNGILESRVAPSGTVLRVAWPQSTLDNGAAALSSVRYTARHMLLIAVAAVIASLVLFILLLVWTGRRRADGTRRLYAWDRIFIELQLALMIVATTVGFTVVSEISSDFLGTGLSTPLVGFGSACAAVLCAFELWCLLSIVRVIKAGLLARRLLTWVVLSWVGRGIRGLARAIKSGFDGRNPLAKTILLVALLWLATAIATGSAGIPVRSYAVGGMLVLFAILALALYFTVKWVKRYGELKRGVEEIAGGNLSYKIPVRDGAASEFEKLSMKINKVGDASELAMRNELKNQRLKTDLISNVSHDLKTPLTSIITYTDILKREGLDCEGAAGYLDIIDEKSRRLKKLTEDLFEAAKASSGAMPVRKERIDLLALIGQELVEHGDGLAGIDLKVVVGAEKEHYYVDADSQLLWRVVDNLLNNVRKYAMPGSRVYIDLKEQEVTSPSGAFRGATSLEIKNTSAAMLNIAADDLMERFQRGDESRATEGSGLGLSIAGDLVRLMDGKFEITIDGDLFKAAVNLNSLAE
jgi:signal transduction histidine kinase